jgi:hypothetical protein
MNNNSDELEQILSMLRKSEEELLRERKALSEQSTQVNTLIMFVEKYLEQGGTEPRTLEAKIHSLKLMISEAK